MKNWRDLDIDGIFDKKELLILEGVIMYYVF